MDKPFSAHMNFAGRSALVTDGASGIGFAVARQLTELGAKIAFADVNIGGCANCPSSRDRAKTAGEDSGRDGCGRPAFSEFRLIAGID